MPRGGTSDVHKRVFVYFLGMQKEIWGRFVSKVTDVCMITGCYFFTYHSGEQNQKWPTSG